MFELDPGLMIWTVVSFFLLLAVLTKLAYKPLLGVLQEREDTIRQSLEGAEKAKEEAVKITESHRKQLADVKTEVKKLIDEGRVAGEEVKKEIIAKAQEEAEYLLARARSEIVSEKEKAVEDLQGEIAELSVQVASKLINKSMSKEDHLVLLNECIAEITEVRN